jgi:hypothetical protein
MDFMIMMPLGPQLMRNLDIGPGHFSALVSAYTISAGFALVALICVPLSYVSIDNNIVYQVVGVGLNALCVFIWAANFTALGLDAANMPAFAPSPGAGGAGGAGGGGSTGSWIAQAYGPLLPTVLFNYGFVATCPSWANEKGPGVSVTRTFAASCVLATFLYLLLKNVAILNVILAHQVVAFYAG